LTNLEKYKAALDQAYTESVDKTLSNLRDGIKEVEADLLAPNLAGDDKEAYEDEIEMLQSLLVASQNHKFFLEQEMPSDYVIPKLQEKFTPEELDAMLELVQSELYNSFFSVTMNLEQDYSNQLEQQVDEYMENLYSKKGH
jgi:cob(I)alamin adenosyltransferase